MQTHTLNISQDTMQAIWSSTSTTTPCYYQILEKRAEQEDVITSAWHQQILIRTLSSNRHAMDPFMPNAQPWKSPSQHNGSRTWSPYCKLSERRSDLRGAHIDRPCSTTHPNSDIQRQRRRIRQWQHPPTAFKIHRHALLLGQRQTHTGIISGVLYWCRSQYSRLFY